MALWLISYDISDNRLRREAVRALADAGAVRVQESVFEGWFDHRGIAALRLELAGIIDPATDSVCAWPLTGQSVTRRIGSSAPPARAPSHWIV
ncbi:CRISPR-associated endonuclease Cas2 [Niveibacterium sp. COAC-50]|uniref:CRISPR-associated endonuclease Cas2 n=1 Tax=Niveibacterium sp. COAC-50 TaxID=2729384 RepID=UPI001554D017|nr:CRISPR-associated endonuclease Cas2 [Niveibacterium sp. COAC-50]